MINFKEMEQTLKDRSEGGAHFEFKDGGVVVTDLPPGKDAVKRGSFDKAVDDLVDRIVDLLGNGCSRPYCVPEEGDTEVRVKQLADARIKLVEEDRIFDAAVARIQSERGDEDAQRKHDHRQQDAWEDRCEQGDMDERWREEHAEELADIRNRKILAACEEHDREVLEYMENM